MDDPVRKAALPDRRVGRFRPEDGFARAAVGEAPYGRPLSGIRGPRLDAAGVRAKSEQAGERSAAVRGRTAARPAVRGGSRDAARDTAARGYLPRRQQE